MDDDQVERTIAEFEQGLAQDDPAFMKRFRAQYRAEITTVVAVFLLLACGTVLLAVGLATISWPTWIAGLVAFAASIAIDEHHKRALRRTR
jgi:urea transporter